MVDVIILDRRRREKGDVYKEEEDGSGNGGDSREKSIEVVVASPGIGHEVMAAGGGRNV